MKIAMLTLLLLVPISAVADDENHYAAMGFGTQTCATFAQQYALVTSIEDEWFTWAQGYMSAMNVVLVVANEPYHNLSATDIPSQKLALREYCDAHPLKLYQTAVESLYFSFPERQPPKN